MTPTARVPLRPPAFPPPLPPPTARVPASPTDGLQGPDDPERARRLCWASLLQRVFRRDVLECPECGGRMRLVAFISDEKICRKILDRLGLPSRAPPRGRPPPRLRPGQQPLPGIVPEPYAADPPYTD